jgi:hypothetical protein
MFEEKDRTRVRHGSFTGVAAVSAVLLLLFVGGLAASATPLDRMGAVSASRGNTTPAVGSAVGSDGLSGVGNGSGATVSSDPTYFVSLSADLRVNGLAGMIVPLGELPLSTVRAFLSVNGDPSATEYDILTADRTAFETSSGLHLDFNWGSLLAAAVGGCVGGAIIGGLIGAAAGGIGALPGAGIGCVAGAAAGALGDTIAQLWSTIPINRQALQVGDAEAGNNLRLVNGQAQAIEALLPATSYFWYRLADVAAMQQIGNSTWNASLDLEQSTMIPQLGTATTALIAEANDVFVQWQELLSANGETLSAPAGTVPTGVAVITVNTGSAWVFNGSTVAWQYACNSVGCAACPSGSPATFAYGAGDARVSSTPSSCATRGSSSAGYWATYPVSGSGVLSSWTPNSPGTAEFNTVGWTSGVPFCLTGSCTYTTQFQVNGWEVSDSYTGGTIGDDPPYYLDLLPNVTGVFNDIAGIEVNAIASGQVYWNYLRALGYTNPAQIPAKFQILPPAETMPPTMCIDNVSIYGGTGYNGACLNLNYTELNSLYLAWMASLAHFFNSTTYQNGPSPCSSAGNCTSWGNLNEYGRGSVYVPGATSSTGHTEVFGNVSTWNVTDSQLLFFPEIVPESIPVGQVWEVPLNGPLEVYVVQAGELLSLTGNGTAVAQVAGNSKLVPAANSTAGDALYLQSCDDNGTNASACDVSPYTVNITIVQLLCSLNSSTCPSPPSTGGGLTIGGIGCDFLSLFGLPCTGIFATIGEILLLVVAIVVVGLILYLLYRVASAGGGRSRGAVGPLFVHPRTRGGRRRFRGRGGSSRGAMQAHHAVVLGLGVVFAGAGIYAFYLSEETLTGTSLGLFILGALFVFGSLTFAFLEDR